MKIVHVCLTGGYTEGFTYQENYLSKYHAKLGHQVTLITTQFCWHKDQWGQCLDSNYSNKYGVRVIRIPYKYQIPYKINTYIGRFVGLYSLLDDIKPDFIFVHNLQFNDIDQIVKYKKNNSNVRIVVDNHSDFSNSARNWIALNILYKIYWRRNAQKIKNYAERFYGVLPARVEFLKEVYKLPAEKCELLVMGADDEEVKRAGSEENQKKVRESLNISNNDFLIVTGGKIDKWKTQTLLLMEAVRDLKKENVKLLIFGPVSDAIKVQFDQLYDEKLMRYVSWADTAAAYDYFAIADLVVFPGRHSVYWEQAAGQGRPMLCKYWDGTTHVDLGGNVEFLRKDSIEEVYDKISSIIDSPDKYTNMKNVAVKKGMNVFSYMKIAERSIDDCV